MGSEMCIRDSINMPRHILRSITPASWCLAPRNCCAYPRCALLMYRSIRNTNMQRYEGSLVDRYLVHRHIMCVVIRTYLVTRVSLFGGRGGRSTRRRAGAGNEACTGNVCFTLVSGTACVGTYLGCAPPATSIPIGAGPRQFCLVRGTSRRI